MYETAVISTTAVEHHMNIVRFAWMKYSKMRKMPSLSFCLCSWFKRRSMSFGKKKFCHEVHILLFLKAGFLSRSSWRMLSVWSQEADCLEVLHHIWRIAEPPDCYCHSWWIYPPWSEENSCFIWSDLACHHSLFTERCHCRSHHHRLCGRRTSQSADLKVHNDVAVWCPWRWRE